MTIEIDIRLLTLLSKNGFPACCALIGSGEMVDLDSFSLDELKSLQKDVAKAIENFQTRKRAEALAAIEAAAKDHGFTLAELTDGAIKAKPAPKPAKYRHPENPEVTWSGRGRQPAWIKEALAAGKSLEQFLVN